MKSTLQFIFAFLSLFFSISYAHAGAAVSGGGAGIYCISVHEENGNVEDTAFVQIFDYYESSTLRGIHQDLGAEEMPFMDKVHLVIDRIEKFDPVRARLYRSYADLFLKDARIIPNIVLSNIDDVKGIAMPADCEPVQIASQRERLFPQDPYYVISKDLWDLMDNNSKAGLVLHEIAYREFRNRFDIEDSTKSRYFNAMLSSDLAAHFSYDDYHQIAENSGMNVDFGWRNKKTNQVIYFWVAVRPDYFKGGGPTPARTCTFSHGGRPATLEDMTVLDYAAFYSAIQERHYTTPESPRILLTEPGQSKVTAYVLFPQSMALEPDKNKEGYLVCVIDAQ